MKQAARVVIIRKNKILLVHRLKQGKEYYVLPGGALERGESPRQAAVREAREETSLKVELGDLLWELVEEVRGERKKGYYFLVKNFRGEAKFNGPELRNSGKDNQYALVWFPLKKIEEAFLYPVGLSKKIRQKFFRE